MEGLNVRLEKRFYVEDAEKRHEDCYTGEVEILETWNTSEANPYHSQTYAWDAAHPFDVCAVIDKIPHGYSYYGREIAEYVCGGALYTNDSYPIAINLQKEKYADADFPIQGTYTKKIRFADVVTGEPIENLDCVLVDMTTGETLCSWNTSETPEMIVTGLAYCFEDWHMKNTKLYAIQILNMPEHYVVFAGKSTEIVYLVYAPILLETGQDTFETVVKLENTDPDAPQVTYISSKETEITTTATESTATQTEAETTEAATETTVTDTTTESAMTTESESPVQIASDEELCNWAAKDYRDKTGTNASAFILDKADGTLTIAIKDESGNTVDTYTIDAASGIGTDSGNAEVNLPQTGNNSSANLLAAAAALLLTAAGAGAVYASGILRKRKEK